MNTAHPSSSDAHHQRPGGGERLLKRCVSAVLIVAMQVQALAQVTSPIMRNATGAVVSGFSNKGTLMFGGQVLGNPHQLMHDLQNPVLWTAGALSFSDNTNPTFVQPTIDQMMQAIEPPGGGGGLFMSRLYLNPDNPYSSGGVLSEPPSLTPELGSSAPAAGPLMDNRTHYERALAHVIANQGDRAVDRSRWSTTNGDLGNGVAYLAKTHVNSSAALRETLFDTAPARAVFQATQTPTAGASAFFVIQGAQAQAHLANVQLHNAQRLGSRIYFGNKASGPVHTVSLHLMRNWVRCPQARPWASYKPTARPTHSIGQTILNSQRAARAWGSRSGKPRFATRPEASASQASATMRCLLKATTCFHQASVIVKPKHCSVCKRVN
jgi:hypothetical protein